MTRVLMVLLAALTVAAPAAAQLPPPPAAAGVSAAPDGDVDLSQGPVVIRQTELDRQVKRIATGIRCVVCRGQSIQESPSELAQEMRAVVREQLLLGKSEQEVQAYFVERYGKQVLLIPEASGFNLVVYILPLLVLLGGAAFVYSKAKNLTKARPGADASEDVAAAGASESSRT
jgi:cytochrome c-type biogenesis protein CcmH/NrfF